MVAFAPSAPRARPAASGSARYTWKVSRYEPVIAPENSRNGRLASTVRHCARTPSRSRPAPPPRAGRARHWSTVSAAKTAAATVQTAVKSAASRASPASGPSSMPAW